MIYLLFIMTAIFLWVYWNASGKELFSVTVIIVSINMLMIGLAITSMKIYGINDINISTALVLFGSYVFLAIGESTGRRISVNTASDNSKERKEIVIPKIVLFAFFLSGIYCIYLTYVNFMRVAALAGYFGDFLTVFPKVRHYLTHELGTLDKSFLLNQLTVFVNCTGYYSFYAFMNNSLFFGKRRISYIIPIIPGLIVSLMSTGRVDSIKYLVILLMIGFLLMKLKSGWQRKTNRKMLKWILIGFVAVILVFRGGGYLTGKSVTRTTQQDIYRYFSNSLFTFDYFLNSNYNNSAQFGERTLRSLYSFINLFGFRIPLGNQFASFYPVGIYGDSDNVVTGLYYPILDYGVLITLLLRMIIGFLYAIYIKKIKNINLDINCARLYFVGVLFYPIFMSAIADVFGSILSLTHLYSFIYLMLFKRVFEDQSLKILRK